VVTVWKSADKQKLQQHMDDNRSVIPSMMFLGIMDIMMFNTDGVYWHGHVKLYS
jgi:hypothetical protein